MHESDLGEYVLSAELVGHDRDVRGVCALRSGDIATTSRDNTVRIWRRDSSEGLWPFAVQTTIIFCLSSRFFFFSFFL
jgi:WD40 repeat protein